MNPVYLAGRGLASALGPDLATAVQALRAGGVAPVPVEVAPGMAWPVYRMTEADGDWAVQSGKLARQVAGESGALAGARDMPLFIASSSLDVGTLEDHEELHGDYQHFADTVAGWIGWQGPVYTVSTACTSALVALMSAQALLQHGDADEALVLGLELRNRVSIAGFGGMQLLSPDRALPFGRDRNGLVLGEAVAALRLSTTPSRWRLRGGANVVDGQDPAGSVLSATVAMVRQALAASGLSASDIDLVKPQAAGSPANDATEAAALREVFTAMPSLVSLKTAIGHTLGASGAAELALLMACLETGTWPRLDHAPDDTLGTPFAPQAPARMRHLLAQILGFGGGHAAVVLEDCSA